MNRRLAVFLLAAFVFSWAAWGALLALTHAGGPPARPVFFVLLLLGGLGPAGAALLAFARTRGDPVTATLKAGLVRWRVSGWWYLVAFGLPILLALGSTVIGGFVDPAYRETIRLQRWYLFFPLFLFMIPGGGLEEVGWRGLLQPDLDRFLGRWSAPLVVGLIWAAWHLPLFWIPGVGQYEMSFPLFAIGVIGGAAALAWLYRRTGSVPLCLVFHATSNAIAELGFALPSRGRLALLDSGLRLALGIALLASGPARPRREAPGG